MISAHDKTILRDLAKAYRDICNSDRNRRKLERWRKLNDLKSDRPLVFCNVSLLGDEIAEAVGRCQTPLKGIESGLKRSLPRPNLGPHCTGRERAYRLNVRGVMPVKIIKRKHSSWTT